MRKSYAAWTAAIGAAVLLTRAATPHGSVTIAVWGLVQDSLKKAPARASEEEARTICSKCHLFPPPDILPRASWGGSIVKMQRFLDGNFDPQPLGTASAAAVPLRDELQRVLAYYEAHAPERLADPETWPPSDQKIQFVRRALRPRGADPTPAISSVCFADVDGDARTEIVATDMRHGLVLVGRPYDAASSLEVVADADNPSHVEVADLDGDGARDLIVADLGQFFPADHDKGSVLWLRASGKGGFVPYQLRGFPRVADVQAADIDGDSDTDLVVAAFRLWKSGFIAWLENRTTDYSHPNFVTRRLDERSGAIHVPVVDLNGDGRRDVLALISQQHETVVAFMNTGSELQVKSVYVAPHPNTGSSAMHIVDLDRDGDLDVVLASGDTFDDQILKPYHGVQWLENRGVLPFVAHRLAGMPGVQHVQAIDLDGDGDLDIVASALVASGAGGAEGKLPSIVWLEQTRPGQFAKHTLESGAPYHAAFDAGDYDGDGDVDLAVGNFAPSHEMPAWVEIWENVTKRRNNLASR